MGLRLRIARFPWRCGLRRLRSADRARHVPEGHRRRIERSSVALRRQQRLLGGRIFPQARRQRRRRRPAHQQGRRDRRSAGVRRRRGDSGARVDPGGRRHPPQERQLRDHRAAGRAAGHLCSRRWRPMSPCRRRTVPSRSPKTSCSDSSTANPSAVTSFWSRRRWKTCAARRSRPSPPSKSFTTRFERRVCANGIHDTGRVSSARQLRPRRWPRP